MRSSISRCALSCAPNEPGGVAMWTVSRMDQSCTAFDARARYICAGGKSHHEDDFCNCWLCRCRAGFCRFDPTRLACPGGTLGSRNSYTQTHTHTAPNKNTKGKGDRLRHLSHPSQRATPTPKLNSEASFALAEKDPVRAGDANRPRKGDRHKIRARVRRSMWPLDAAANTTLQRVWSRFQWSAMTQVGC